MSDLQQVTNGVPSPFQMPTVGSDIEKLLIQGDLSQLKPDQRVTYYNALCQSLGLNPLTKPFEYLNLSGKLVLYARKDCTEQLRNIHSISLDLRPAQVIDGIYVVQSMANKPGGRIDVATGAVSIEGLKGEAKANAMMKAETKAKRRVTLSICGLGMLDEAEIESLPDARIDTGPYEHGTRDAAVYVGERKMLEAPQPVDPDKPWKTFKEFLKLMEELKAEIGEDEYYRVLGGAGYEHANEIKKTDDAKELYRRLLEKKASQVEV